MFRKIMFCSLFFSKYIIRKKCNIIPLMQLYYLLILYIKTPLLRTPIILYYGWRNIKSWRGLINLVLSRTGLYSSNQISTWLINNGAFHRSFSKLKKKTTRVENYLWLRSIRRCTIAADNGIIISFPLSFYRYVTELTDERSYRLHTVARMQSNRIRSSERIVAIPSRSYRVKKIIRRLPGKNRRTKLEECIRLCLWSVPRIRRQLWHLIVCSHAAAISNTIVAIK